MTSAACTRARRGRIVTVALVALTVSAVTVSAVTVSDLAVTASMPAVAARQQRTPLQTNGFVLSAPAAMTPGEGRMTAASSGGFIYQSGRYTTLDSLAGLPTAHTAINNRGQIAGSYAPDQSTVRGFIRDSDGHYTAFDGAPGATTFALGMNDNGTVVGAYGVTEAHGFVRSPDGVVTTVDVPDSLSTTLYDINNRGVLVGGYVDADGREHGLRLDRGVLTTIDPPGSPANPQARNTDAVDINDKGQIVGFYADVEGTYHGYLYANGRFTRIDPPGAANVPNFATTVPWGINDRGQVVGQYVDAAGVLHGYLWQPGRGFTTIDPPQITSFDFGVPGAGTIAADINDRGQILLPAPGGLYKGRLATIPS
ncbi:MAG: hypothetical protein J2P29_10250 [Actinobacteria bacterium]|nr:hypothetical protein [Actinomycetota bacterium]